MNIAIIIGAVAALVCLIVAFRFFHKKRLIDDLPTSKVLGVFIGLVELKGTAESESPLTSRLAGVSCVLYEWHVDEHWSRTVVETYHDSKGTHTRTRHESGWKTVAKGSDSAPFYLKDDTGIIRIQPAGAKIEDNEVFDKTVTRTDALYFGKGPANEIANTDHRRRFQETAIPLHTPLYVVGQARQREDIVAAEVANDKNNQLFITSTRTEKQVSTGYGIWLWVWALLGLILAIAGVLIGNLTRPLLLRMNWEPYVIAVGGYIFTIAIAWIWTVFNSLVGVRQRVQQAWAQVDIQLKRRYDLIPNLIEAVEGYAAHEREVQELVTRLRQQMTATPPGITGPDYSGFSPSLQVTVERYPDLKSSELFLKLQQSLTETEQRIALARDYFNNIASFYNARLELVPDRFIAKSMKLRPQTLLSAADFERAPVQIKLAD